MYRFGMNLRAVIEKSISNFPPDLPLHVKELVNKIQHEVSRDSIESFTFMARDTNPIGNLDNKNLGKLSIMQQRYLLE